MSNSPDLVNPQLDGGPFFLEGGPQGAVLIHGFTATSAEVRPLSDLLHGCGFTVGAPLLPGHFARPAEINRYRWQDWYAAAERMYLRVRASCERVVVGGESTGGLLSLYLATRYPEVQAVLSYASALQLTLTPLDMLKVRLAAPFLTAVPKKPGAPNPYWQGYQVNPLKGVLELLRLQRVVRGSLPRLRQPLLVVQGREDGTVRPEAAEIIYREAGSSVKALHWMERSGHVVLIDQEMDQVHKLTLDFLAEVGFDI